MHFKQISNVWKRIVWKSIWFVDIIIVLFAKFSTVKHTILNYFPGLNTDIITSNLFSPDIKGEQVVPSWDKTDTFAPPLTALDLCTILTEKTCRGKWLTGKERALHSKPPVCLNLKLIIYIQLRRYRHNTLLGRGHNSKNCYNYSTCQWFTLHRSKHKVVWSEISKFFMFAWVKIKYLELQNEFCSRMLNWYLELWNLGMNNVAMEKE